MTCLWPDDVPDTGSAVHDGWTLSARPVGYVVAYPDGRLMGIKGGRRARLYPTLAQADAAAKRGKVPLHANRVRPVWDRVKVVPLHE